VFRVYRDLTRIWRCRLCPQTSTSITRS
jgi:hypothetical protein